MKRIVSLLLISAILTGCGHISDDSPDVAEETTTVSRITETTASDAIKTTVSAVTVTSEVTTNNSSQSVTEKTAIEGTTAAENTKDQPKKDNKKTQNSQDNNAQEVKQNENKTTTPVQTTPRKAESLVETENKATQAARTTTPVVTTAPPAVTQPPRQTEPPRRTEPPVTKQQILDYDRLNDQMQTFIDGYDIDYDWLYEKGKNLSHDGTDYGKAVAICQETESMGGVNCINYAINAYFMAQGAGLECYIARSSKYDWYGHVANIVKLDGKWYYMEPMGDVVGAPNTFAEGGIADDGSVITYPDGLDIVTDIYDNRKNVTVERGWYK